MKPVALLFLWYFTSYGYGYLPAFSFGGSPYLQYPALTMIGPFDAEATCERMRHRVSATWEPYGGYYAPGVGNGYGFVTGACYPFTLETTE